MKNVIIKTMFVAILAFSFTALFATVFHLRNITGTHI